MPKQEIMMLQVFSPTQSFFFLSVFASENFPGVLSVQFVPYLQDKTFDLPVETIKLNKSCLFAAMWGSFRTSENRINVTVLATHVLTSSPADLIAIQDLCSIRDCIIDAKGLPSTNICFLISQRLLRQQGCHSDSCQRETKLVESCFEF